MQEVPLGLQGSSHKLQCSTLSLPPGSISPGGFPAHKLPSPRSAWPRIYGALGHLLTLLTLTTLPPHCLPNVMDSPPNTSVWE